MVSFYALVQEFIMHLTQCMVWLSTVTMVWAEQPENCSLISWQRQTFFSSKLHLVQLWGPSPIQWVPGTLPSQQSRLVLNLTIHFHLVSILMVWRVIHYAQLPSVQHNCGIINYPMWRISGCGFLDFFQ